MTIQTISLSELAAARARIYQLLASIYAKPPDAAFLKMLEAWVASQVQSGTLYDLPSEQIRQSLISLNGFFKTDPGELQRAVSIEFTRLFRGVKPHYSPLPPYESVYREEGGRVFGKVSVEVLHFYRKCGFDLAGDFKSEPPDHLSFELEFMHLLCGGETQALEEDNEAEAVRFAEAQQDFLREHLLAWLTGFCAKVREFDCHGFYRSLVDLTEGWVRLDYQQHLQEHSGSRET